MASSDPEAKNFTPLDNQTKVGLKQVDPAAGSPDLVVALPPGEKQVMVGVVGIKQRLQWNKEDPASMLEVGSWFVAVALVLAAGLAVVRKIWNNEIDLKTVISEADGKASLARFQALLFTFIFLIAFVLVVANTGDFPREIPGAVLAILAGSAGTYLMAKYIGGDASTSVMAGSSSRILWGSDPNALALNEETTPVRIRVPFGGATASVAARDYKVVAVGVGPVRLELRVMATGGAKGEVYYRRGGEAAKKINGSEVIDCPINKTTEIAVAAFGGAASDIVDLEIKKA